MNRHKWDILSPELFANSVGIVLDPWQLSALKDSSPELILNCFRQSGKSTIAALKALYTATSRAMRTIVIISPTLRQSGEIYRMVDQFYMCSSYSPLKVRDTLYSMELVNGSRIIALPGTETSRGIPAVDLLIEDEASRVIDEVSFAAAPTLATKNGQHMMLSTPAGMRGHFYKACMTEGKKVYTIRATDAPRISPEFLERMKEVMGSRMFAQEFMCEFLAEGDMSMFRRFWFPVTNAAPKLATGIRAWDMAATQDGGDYTASCLMRRAAGRFYIQDVTAWQLSPRHNELNLQRLAESDTKLTAIRMEQEPGSSGVSVIDHYKRNVLQGFDFEGVGATGSKIVRATPFSAACEAGKVSLVKGDWNEMFLEQLSQFPFGEHDDMVDAAALAYNTLAEEDRFNSNRLAKMIVR